MIMMMMMMGGGDKKQLPRLNLKNKKASVNDNI